MLSVLLLPGIQWNFKKLSKTKWQTRTEYPAQHQVILWHLKVAPKACFVPEYHNELIRVLLEQFHLALTKSLQQLASHDC